MLKQWLAVSKVSLKVDSQEHRKERSHSTLCVSSPVVVGLHVINEEGEADGRADGQDELDCSIDGRGHM